MKYTTTITSQGQITLPVKIRDMFGIKPKDKLEVFESNGEIKLRPANSFLDLKGSVKSRKKISPKDMDDALTKSIKGEYEGK